MMTGKENPYIRIMKAAKRGVGVNLSANEVRYLSQDSAIEQVAASTAEGETVTSGGYRVTRYGFEDTNV